ncbi:unnamed protein product [Adineta ricciae]|uniref:G-protein coupled receptors family 1 profile domain-containing protein n=1 Tax=Adineta ricciae TaxID=249248 RepID=A0A814MN74_ADIRI|nr:unnamed protein product [Adineta ricciae]
MNSTEYPVTEEEIAYTAILGTIVYIGGFIGNFLSLTIFVREDIRHVSTGLLFLFLTISNSFQLLTLTIEFIDVAYNIRLFACVVIRCRILYWFQNIFRALSSYTACTISCDRMFRALYPIRAKQVCTCRVAWRIVCIYYFVFACSLTFYLLPFMQENSDGICITSSDPTYDKFLSVIWPPIRTVVVCVLPVSIMISTNIFLWRRVRESRRRTSPLSSHTDRMLIFITISNVLAFIITQIPFHVYATIVRYKQSIEHMRTPMLLWSSLYFGIGFYIYSLTSPYFRSKFLLSLRHCFQRQNSNRIHQQIQQYTISQRNQSKK